MRIIQLAVIATLIGSAPLTAPLIGRSTMATADSLSPWATALAGQWSCAGAFASGKPLAADLEFTPALGDRWLRYHHQDRAPGRYQADALLGPATGDSALVSTMLYDNFGGHRQFDVSNGNGGITLLRNLTGGKAQAERFVFRARPEGLRFGWELQVNGAWTLGDSLACRRTP